MNNKQLMQELGNRPIAYYEIYTELTGSITCGLLLSQIMYWSDYYKNGFWHTDKQFCEEINMTAGEIRTAKKKLKSFSWITIKTSIVNGATKTFYSVDFSQYRDCIANLACIAKLTMRNQQNGIANQQNGIANNAIPLKEDKNKIRRESDNVRAGACDLKDYVFEIEDLDVLKENEKTAFEASQNDFEDTVKVRYQEDDLNAPTSPETAKNGKPAIPSKPVPKEIDELAFKVFGSLPIQLPEWVQMYPDDWIKEALYATYDAKATSPNYTKKILQTYAKNGGIPKDDRTQRATCPEELPGYSRRDCFKKPSYDNIPRKRAINAPKCSPD